MFQSHQTLSLFSTVGHVPEGTKQYSDMIKWNLVFQVLHSHSPSLTLSPYSAVLQDGNWEMSSWHSAEGVHYGRKPHLDNHLASGPLTRPGLPYATILCDSAPSPYPVTLLCRSYSPVNVLPSSKSLLLIAYFFCRMEQLLAIDSTTSWCWELERPHSS